VLIEGVVIAKGSSLKGGPTVPEGKDRTAPKKRGNERGVGAGHGITEKEKGQKRRTARVKRLRNH